VDMCFSVDKLQPGAAWYSGNFMLTPGMIVLAFGTVNLLSLFSYPLK